MVPERGHVYSATMDLIVPLSAGQVGRGVGEWMDGMQMGNTIYVVLCWAGRSKTHGAGRFNVCQEASWSDELRRAAPIASPGGS